MKLPSAEQPHIPRPPSPEVDARCEHPYRARLTLRMSGKRVCLACDADLSDHPRIAPSHSLSPASSPSDSGSQGTPPTPGVPCPKAAHPQGMPALACDGCGILGKELASVGEAGSALLLCIRCYDEAVVTVRLR